VLPERPPHVVPRLYYEARYVEARDRYQRRSKARKARREAMLAHADAADAPSSAGQPVNEQASGDHGQQHSTPPSTNDVPTVSSSLGNADAVVSSPMRNTGFGLFLLVSICQKRKYQY